MDSSAAESSYQVVRWQSDDALDCKPGLGRFDSYPDLQVNAGILLGEDSAFQADEAGSNPTTRSN